MKSSATAALAHNLNAASDSAPVPIREFYELRCYRMKAGASRASLERYFENALLPALAARHVSPVGVFTEIHLDHQAAQPIAAPQVNPPIWVLIPHPTLESFVWVSAELNGDPVVQEAGAEYLQSSMTNPAFERIDVCLLRAFAGLPKLDLPAFSRTRDPNRVFELRSYESFSELTALKKVAMFNDGEIDIMQAAGLSPVFYGQALAGPDLPHLSYMTGGQNLTAHLEHWKSFVGHPRWQKMKADPQYADTVSKITKHFLVPAACSQI